MIKPSHQSRVGPQSDQSSAVCYPAGQSSEKKHPRIDAFPLTEAALYTEHTPVVFMFTGLKAD